ncbi:MAG: RdgB/HAM1 family non-canonical purine NTP pyrophosphatase [Actinobacteria bacterium]|nr:RdgB/HAM1 family non-canonical purine NTP pyrophosphatase [Actinomycetota bacterium]MBU1492721.1 RdgB/HAM1 family non-canonical purine NTP pyrophosphatase [Actinomycetota bacterium]
MPRRVVVGTKNPDKLAEMIAVLRGAVPDLEVVEGASWPDVEETGATLVENALLKARAVAAATGCAAIADDTGLEVDALDGRPGVHAARFAGPAATYAENRQRMLADLTGVEDRVARFRTVVVMVAPGEGDLVVEGVLEGRIATAERGSFGFGYDSIFEVGERTLAEIPQAEKNRMSHRAMALRALADRLISPACGGDVAEGDRGGG